MRKIIIIASVICIALCAIISGVLQMVISHIPTELIEYNSSEKWGAEGYVHMAAYMTSDAGFDANSYLRVKSEITDKYTVDSIDTVSALYALSREEQLTLTSSDGKRTSSCNASVYLGDYFIFHPIELIEGAYPDRESVLTDAIVIDEYASWQLFGTQSGVVGLEVRIGNDIYVVSAVAKVPDGVYKEVYSDKPRIYINADSAGMRTKAADRKFTAFDLMLPDPITNYASNTVNETLSSYDPVIVNIDKRFKHAALDEMREKQISLIIDSDRTEYPYTEKAMIILSLRAADIYAVQKVIFTIGIVGLAVLLLAVYGPIVRAIEKLLSKIKF